MRADEDHPDEAAAIERAREILDVPRLRCELCQVALAGQRFSLSCGEHQHNFCSVWCQVLGAAALSRWRRNR